VEPATITNELRSWPEYRDTSVFELNRQYTRHTLEVVLDAIARGEFRKDVSPRIVRDMIFGGCEHHSWAYLRGEGDFDPQTAADAITDLIYRGLATGVESGARAVRDPLHRLERIADRLEGLAHRARPRRAVRGNA
jgi:TetR/AcrR family transcriptional regulator, fatty acid metabolism regulator protein